MAATERHSTDTEAATSLENGIVERKASTEFQNSEKSQARQLKPISWFLVVFSLLAALFLFALDNTIVADVQPSIIETLGGIDKLPWISVAFALGAISTNLFW